MQHRIWDITDVCPSLLHVPSATAHRGKCMPTFNLPPCHLISFPTSVLHSVSITTQPWHLLCHTFTFIIPWMQRLLLNLMYFIRNSAGPQFPSTKWRKMFWQRQAAPPSLLKTASKLAQLPGFVHGISLSAVCYLSLQLFLKHFSALPRLPGICCYPTTADGTGVK